MHVHLSVLGLINYGVGSVTDKYTDRMATDKVDFCSLSKQKDQILF